MVLACRVALRRVRAMCFQVPAPRPVQLLPALPAPGPRTQRTTLMLRNLPNNYTRNMACGLFGSGRVVKSRLRQELCKVAEVCTMMDKEGFKGSYDFIYLPIAAWQHAFDSFSRVGR